MSRHSRLLAVAFTAALAIAACSGGGSGPSANDPASSVKAGLEAAESGGVNKMLEYVCAAQKDEINTALTGGLEGLEGSGVDVAALMNSVKFDLENVQTNEVSRNGNNAVVHVKGTMKMTFDQAALKDMMKKVMEAQGLPADDATIDMALQAMGSALSQATELDEDIDVVNEGGKWLICSDISGTG